MSNVPFSFISNIDVLRNQMNILSDISLPNDITNKLLFQIFYTLYFHLS